MFDLFDGLLTGQFDSITLPDLSAAGLSWDTADLYTTGQIAVIPEPATMGLLAIGAVAVLRRGRR